METTDAGKSSRYLVSAKGAAFMSKPGAALQDYGKSENTSTESAIHFVQWFESTRQLDRAFGARLRGNFNSWRGPTFATASPSCGGLVNSGK
jgi:hypothetical protein